MSDYRHPLASTLAGWCAVLLPRDRAIWAAAMKAEVDAIDDGNAAVTFAVGCVFGSIKERMLTMNFAARTVRFGTIALMLTLALAAAVIAGRVDDANAPSALIFGMTSALFAGAAAWSLLRGPLALVRAASTMIPVYMIAYAFVRSDGNVADQWVDAALYRALAIEGVVIWAALLAGGIFMVRAGTPQSVGTGEFGS